jgi:type I restriction enzyme S subunit
MGDRENLSELLKGWAKTKIGEIIECLDYQRVPVSKEVRAKRIGNIPYYGANGQVDWIDDYLFDEPLVLVVEDETFIGREKPFSYKITGKSWVNNHAHVLRAIAVDTDYLNYSLWYYPFTPLTTGTTGRRKLTKSALMSAPYLLPPLPEQHRIVAKIDELFSELDVGVELLKKLKAKLKRYRQSVLKAAVEGKLTKDWREAHQGELEPASVLLERILKERREKWEAEQLAQMKAKDKTPKDEKWKLKYKEPVAPDITYLSQFPKISEGWTLTSIETITYRLTYGITVRPQYVDEGIPIVSAREIRSGEVDFNIVKKISLDDFNSLRSKCKLILNDVLFSKTGTIGSVARVKTNELLCCSQNVAVLSPIINSQYLELFLKSPFVQKLAKSQVKTTAIPDLQLGIIARFPIPLPPILEQNEIIQKIEYAFSIADELEKSIDKNLKRAKKLRQSILKKAFEGKLVPQDLTDEPADKLLERIKAEKAKREAEAKAKKKRKQPEKSQQLELF